MRTFYSFIIILAFSFSSYAQVFDEWEIQNPKPTANLLSDFCFVNDSVGWVVGERGTILKTTDAGENWKTQESGTNLWLMAVSFVDESVGFAAGNNATFIYTTDGGETWNPIEGYNGFEDPITTIYVKEPDTVWYGSYNGLIYGCFHYGEKWVRRSSNRGGTINSLTFLSKKRGIAAGGTATQIPFYKVTEDYGETWSTPSNIDIFGEIHDMVFVDSLTGFLSSEKYGEKNKIFKSTDGGQSWNEIYSYQGNPFRKLQFLNNKIGFALTGGGLLKTENGGKDWEGHYINIGMNFYLSMFFTNDSTGLVGGYSGSIAKTINSGSSWNQKTEGYYYRVTGISFPTAMEGWATTQWAILHTDDGGLHWNDAGFTNILNAFGMQFSDQYHGWFINHGWEFYRTIDKGVSWDSLGRISEHPIRFLYFYNTMKGWSYDSYNNLFKTIDGGVSWFQVMAPENTILRSITQIKDKVWLLCKDAETSETLLFSMDAEGSNWELNQSFNEPNAYIIKSAPGEVLFILAANSQLFKSTNSGEDWALISNEVEDYFSNLFPLNGNEIYTINAAGDLFYTSDGGNTWIVSHTHYRGLLQLYFLYDQGWVAGENGLIAHINTLTLDKDQVDELDVKNTLLYPNPGNETIYVNTHLKQGFIYLTDLSGRVISINAIHEGTNSISSGTLKKGVYIVIVKDINNKTVKSGKWIKI